MAITLQKPLAGGRKEYNVTPYVDQSAYNKSLQNQATYNTFMNYANNSGSSNSGSGNIFNAAVNAVKQAKDLGTQAANATVAASSSSGNGGGVNPTAPSQSTDYMNQLSAMLQAQQAQQQAALQQNQQAQQALVEQVYQNNLNNLNSAYGNSVNNLGNTLNGTLGQLEQNYNYSADQLNATADNALRQAYINRMLAEKNLEQRLNAQGLTGGAAESAVAQLLNNYGSARNSIETQRANDLADLLNTYQNNSNSARSQYNDALNNLIAQNYGYQRQLQNDLANGVIGTYDDLYGALNSGYNTYANAMQGLAANQVGNAADLAATNYKNYLNAMNKANNASSSSSSSSGNGIANRQSDTVISVIASKLKNVAYPKEYIKNLVAQGSISQAEGAEILRQAGIIA